MGRDDRTNTFDIESNSPTSSGSATPTDILGNGHLCRTGIGWQVGVFDLVDCGIGCFVYTCDRCWEISRSSRAAPATPTIPFCAALLDGYRSVRRFPVEWERHLPVLMAARHANHCFLTAGQDVSPTPREDATWRMDLARQSPELPF